MKEYLVVGGRARTNKCHLWGVNILMNLTEYESDSTNYNLCCAVVKSRITLPSCFEEPTVTASKFLPHRNSVECITSLRPPYSCFVDRGFLVVRWEEETEFPGPLLLRIIFL
jgi:hypothetical protein